MTEPKLPRTSTDLLCPRCCLPEDLLPIQQAIVLRSFPAAYAAVLNDAEVDGPPFGALSPEVWSPLEHASYVGAMLGAVYIRLRQLLGRELPEPASLVVERQRDPSTPEVQAALARMSDQAERLAQTIVSGAHCSDWRATPFHGVPSPHALIHLAIDEAAEHLGETSSAVLPGTRPLAVAAPGLLLNGRTVPGGTPDLAGLSSGSRDTYGGIVRSLRGPAPDPGWRSRVRGDRHHPDRRRRPRRGSTGCA